MALGATAASADPVFSTAFDFNTTLDANGNRVNDFDNDVNTTTRFGSVRYVFEGVKDADANGSGSTSFGTVTLESATGSGAPDGEFEFFVYQSTPTVGVGSLGGNLFLGSYYVNSKTGHVTLSFDAGTIEIDGIRYDPKDFQEEQFDRIGDSATIYGVVTVPLPPAAWGGMALLGALGCARVRRRLQDDGSL